MSEGHVVFDVPDISCDHCRRAIEAAVWALEGIETVSVDVPGKTVDVRLTGGGAKPADVRRAIEREGYPVAAERSA